MANREELQQCEAKTKDGSRCTRKGTNKRKSKVTKTFLFFFSREEEVVSYRCTQHRNKK